MRAATICALLDGYEVVDYNFPGGSRYEIPPGIMRQAFTAIRNLEKHTDEERAAARTAAAMCRDIGGHGSELERIQAERVANIIERMAGL